MKLLTSLFLLILSTPVNQVYFGYEPKPIRQACSQATYNTLCVPRVLKVETKQVNWI